jgi:hypothetical protein
MMFLSQLTVMAHGVTAHLLGLPGTVAEPREVRLGGRNYAAAWFSQMRELPEGSSARREAVEAHGPTTYAHAGLYVLGALPDAYERASREDKQVVFVEADGRRWYVAAWAGERAVAEHPDMHPFGPWFLLQVQHVRFAPEPERENLEVVEL